VCVLEVGLRRSLRVPECSYDPACLAGRRSTASPGIGLFNFVGGCLVQRCAVSMAGFNSCLKFKKKNYSYYSSRLH
jgi:hypothetical protein